MRTDRWRGFVCVTALAALLGPAGSRAGTPKPAAQPQPLDLGLLEFLGSADPTTEETHADGGSWMVYLSKLSLNKSAAPGRPAAHAPAPAPKPASNSSAAEGSR